MQLTINLDGELTLGELRMLVNTTRHMSDNTEVEYCRADLNTPDDVPDDEVARSPVRESRC